MNSTNNGAREIECGSSDGGEHDKYNDDGLMRHLKYLQCINHPL